MDSSGLEREKKKKKKRKKTNNNIFTDIKNIFGLERKK